ncbi:MAG: signal peptidase II [Vulcanimicrobiaceae bacterium]
MFRSQRFNELFIALVAVVVLWLDQVTKGLVSSKAHDGSYVVMVVPHLLRWNLTQNYHGAFGMFGSNSVLLIGMALIVLVVFWLNFRTAARHSLLVRIAFGLILGGAIGNVVDRLRHGYVIDFIDFYRIWPNIFNVADACVTVGVGLLLISSFATRRNA